jgi:DNA-directed RNA polymerase subunit F
MSYVDGVLEEKVVPIPVVKKILEKLASDPTAHPIIARVYEYASKFSRCDPDAAERAVDELVKLGFSELAASTLVNLMPEQLDEAKALLGGMGEDYDDEVIQKGLETLSSLCGAGTAGQEQ